MKQPSQLLFDLLENFEGLRFTAYQDQGSTFTIGYGTVYYPDGSVVKQGDTCTKEQAQQYLTAHLQGLINHLNATVPQGLAQAQFDSIVDFAYEEGQGAWDSSSLKQLVNSNPSDFVNITTDFCKWDKEHINDALVASDGILRRRKSEAYLYQNGVNHPTFFL